MFSLGLGQLGGVLDLENLTDNSRSTELAVRKVQQGTTDTVKSDEVVIDHRVPDSPGLKDNGGQIGTTQLPTDAEDIYQGGRERFIDLGNHVMDAGSGNFWYGGDFNGVNGLANEEGGLVSDARTYDDFIVPSGHKLFLGGVWSSNLQNYFSTNGSWEIRTGVSEGNGGTLVASGTNVPCALYFTGGTGFGFLELTTSCPSSAVLQPGKYWLNVHPISTTPGVGRSFNSTTSGANGVSHASGTQTTGTGADINNDRSFFDSTYFGYTFTAASGLLGGPTDFSMGVFGGWLG
jgi:hypothetical protein